MRATAPRLTAGSVTAIPHALRRSELVAAEFELGFTFQDKVELLLAARSFIVFSDERLATAYRHENVDAERRQPEEVL